MCSVLPIIIIQFNINDKGKLFERRGRKAKELMSLG